MSNPFPNTCDEGTRSTRYKQKECRKLSIDWNLIGLGSPAHGIVTINCTQNCIGEGGYGQCQGSKGHGSFVE